MRESGDDAMECLIQYLDDIDDAAYAVLMLGERLRRLLRTALVVCTMLLVQVGGVLIALHWPPIALAVVALLAVATLYRSAVSPIPRLSRR